MDILLQYVDQFGYAAFFLALCLGLIGLPIPNEVVIMTAGALAASGVLEPVPTFLAVFLGIASGLTFGYAVGRGAGGAIAKRFAEHRNIHAFLSSAEKLGERYGSFAISISIFLPLLRHITMYAVGLNRRAYWRFAVFAYPTALFWTLGYFIIGTYVESQIDDIGAAIIRYGSYIIWLILGAGAVYIVYRIMRNRRMRQEERSMDS